MKKIIEQILAALKTLNVIPADKEDAVKAELEKLKLEEMPPGTVTAIDTTKITDPAVKQMFEAVNAQNNMLTQQVKDLMTALGEEKQARQRAADTVATQAKAERDKKVKELVAKAKADKKIVEAKADWFTKFAEKDLDAATEWLNGAPVDKTMSSQPQKPGEKKEVDDKGAAPKIDGSLGRVNPTILNKVMEQAQVLNN